MEDYINLIYQEEIEVGMWNMNQAEMQVIVSEGWITQRWMGEGQQWNMLIVEKEIVMIVEIAIEIEEIDIDLAIHLKKDRQTMKGEK